MKKLFIAENVLSSLSIDMNNPLLYASMAAY